MLQQRSEHIRQERTREAVALAMESQWERAAQVNRELLEQFSDDVGAWNRLGKALSELGRYAEAREAFGRALELQPRNPIAGKNLRRLAGLSDTAPAPKAMAKLTPQLFIEESGVATLTPLRNLAAGDVVLQMAPGDTVYLEVAGKSLLVKDSRGEYVGRVEPRLAARLARLQEGGNRYEAAVASVSENNVVVVVREVYQHPSQAGVVSFPRRGDGQPSFIPDVPLPYDSEEEEMPDELRPPPAPAWTEDDGEETGEEEQEPVEGRLAVGVSGDEEENEEGEEEQEP